ncbi:CLN3 protein, partial [Ostertagia ostertagi]
AVIIGFRFRHVLVCLLQAASYVVVAFSESVTESLAGVCIGSLGSGIGEITYLALASRLAIAAWSSEATGEGGLIGSFSIMALFLTERSILNLKPKVALLLQLIVPVVFVLTYLVFLLSLMMFTHAGLRPITWIVPKEVPSKNEEEEDNSDTDSPANETRNDSSSNVKVPQRHLTFIEKIQHI